MNRILKIQYRKILKYTILFYIVFLSTPSFAYFQTGQCSKDGYTVFTINGINTTKTEAQKNLDGVKEKLGSVYKNEEIESQFLYNPTHTAGIADIFDTIDQGSFNKTDDFDLLNIQNDASRETKTQKVLLVGHSQGNFYVNNLYNKIVDKEGGIPKQSIGAYAVATPASYVAGVTRGTEDQNNYLTSDTDRVINKYAKMAMYSLPSNTHISLRNGDDSNGHDFLKIYLEYKSTVIVSGIQSSLNKLRSNTTQDPTKPCITAPKLTVLDKIQKVSLSVTDTALYATVTVPKNMSIALGNKVIRTSDSIVKRVGNTIASAFMSTRSLFASVSDSNNTEENIPPVIEPENKTDISPEATQTKIEEQINEPIDNPKIEEVLVPTEVIAPEIILPTESIKPPPVLHGGSSLPNPTDNTAPVITLVGSDNMSVFLNSIYADAGATATDNVDSTITVVTTGVVDTTIVGTYILTYTANDIAGNTANLTRTVNVILDTGAPVITIIGANPLYIQKNTVYTEPGVTASDAVDGSVAVNTTGSVDTAITGTYTITYTASDAAGNTSTAIRTVEVTGIKNYFNLEKKISYAGNFLICNTDTNAVYIAGNNLGVTTFMSSSNWQTSNQATANSNMPINTNFRFIFGSLIQTTSDCVNNKYLMDYSDTFHYVNSSGSSVVASNEKFITTFSITSLNPNVRSVINETLHTIVLPIATGTDVTNLTPSIISSSNTTLSPSSNVAQNFTNPVVYTVTAPDGSSQIYTVSVVPKGAMLTFDVNNKVSYAGNFLLCNMDNNSSNTNGNNFGITTFISSSNWQTSNQATANSNMLINTNFRFIFGTPSQASYDCTNNTYLNSHSNAFYYTTTSGSSVIYGTYTPPSLSSAKAITAFNFAGLSPTVVGSINETNHTINLTVPFGTNLSSLVPTIAISSGATINPNTNVAQDFTNNQTYTVTAENASTQEYIVTVTITSNSGSDTTPPAISSYTFNGTASNITINPLVNNLTIALVASENVNWMSVKIESTVDSGTYKIFQSSASCVDGTSSCTKVWDGILSSGGLLHDGTFRIKVHIKDASNNEYYEYLSPYIITVDVP